MCDFSRSDLFMSRSDTLHKLGEFFDVLHCGRGLKFAVQIRANEVVDFQGFDGWNVVQRNPAAEEEWSFDLGGL